MMTLTKAIPLAVMLLAATTGLAGLPTPVAVPPTGEPTAIAAPTAGDVQLTVAEPAPLAAHPQAAAGARGTYVYDNTVAGPNAAYSRDPGEEIGDYLSMVGDGILDDVKFSVYNSSNSTLPLTTADLTLRVYDYASNYGYYYAGGLVFNDVDLQLDPGYFSTFTITGLAGFGIPVTSEVLMTLEITDVTGGAEKVGQVLYDPPALGSSTDDFYRDGGTYWFGGSPVANFYWAVGVAPPPGPYCSAFGELVGEHVGRVQLNNLDNANPTPPGSGWSPRGYGDFTDLVATVRPDHFYSLAVTIEGGYSSDIAGVWIDWNQDADFDDPGETIATWTGGLFFSDTIAGPTIYPLGERRMRVRVQDGFFDPVLSPCGDTIYGETEDYTINLANYLDIALVPSQSCYKAGDQVVIDIVLQGNEAEVLSGIFYLSYSDKLDFVSIDPGDAPFTVQEDEDVDEGLREIQYTVAVPTAVPPEGYTNGADIVMARLTFDILADDCDLADAVSWRDPGFPLQTRLSQLANGMSEPLYADHLLAAANITLDTTAPAVSAPLNTEVPCVEDAYPGLALGEATGGIGVYYNNNGNGEVPSNQAYLKAQFAADEADTGAAFLFSNDPLDGLGLLTWQGIFSGLTWPDSQFGFDLVLPAPSADGSVTPPMLNAYDNGDNSVGGRILRGPVTWAINDYKPHAPDISYGDILNSVISSELQTVPGLPNAGDVVIYRNDYAPTLDGFEANFSGKLVSDGLAHWYGVGLPDSPLANLGLSGEFYFEGTLQYDISTDIYPLMDFYAGTITLIANHRSNDVGFATAVDACSLFPIVWYEDVDNGGLGCPGNELLITRTWYAQDDCGNVGYADQVVTVSDDARPVFVTCVDDITVNNDAGLCSAVVSWDDPVVWDSCDGYLVPTATPASGTAFAVGNTQVSYLATDSCNNGGTCHFDVTVVDAEPPTITCPADVTVNADAGGCIATGVSLGTPTTADNCGVAGTTNDAPTQYPVGDTIVTWEVTDTAGLTAECTQTVTVRAQSDLVLNLEVQGPLAADSTRCMTLTFFDCNDPLNPVEFKGEVTFLAGAYPAGSASFVADAGLACGSYSCVLVQDELHTLTRRFQLGGGHFDIVGSQYVVDATGDPAMGGAWLVQGDLYDDTADLGVDVIDVVDLAVYIASWGMTWPDGDTLCSDTFAAHADLDASGYLDTTDRAFVTTNYLTVGETGCCPLLGVPGDGPEPRSEISIVELRTMGLGWVARADLNHDGRIDATDLQLFASGVVPAAPYDATNDRAVAPTNEAPRAGVSTELKP